MKGSILAGLLLLGGLAWAQHGGGMMPPAQRGMMRQSPMMGMMAAADIAAWNGTIYLLNGNTLTKLGADLKPVTAIELPSMTGAMMQGGMCPMCGQMGMAGAPHAMATPPDAMGGGMGQPGAMADMHRMHMMMMMGRPQLTADSQGVYLLRGGQLTVYDQNLKPVRTAQVIDMQAACAMCQRMMQPGGMPSCSTMDGTGMSARVMRTLPSGGQVAMTYQPATLAPGRAQFHLYVLDAAGNPDNNATITAYFYPAAAAAHGEALRMMPAGPGHFIAFGTASMAGDYLLAVRVRRPGMADNTAYFSLTVTAPGGAAQTM